MKATKTKMTKEQFEAAYGGRKSPTVYDWSELKQEGDVVQLENVANVRSAVGSAYQYAKFNGFKVTCSFFKNEGKVAVLRIS